MCSYIFFVVVIITFINPAYVAFTYNLSKFIYENFPYTVGHYAMLLLYDVVVFIIFIGLLEFSYGSVHLLFSYEFFHKNEAETKVNKNYEKQEGKTDSIISMSYA